MPTAFFDRRSVSHGWLVSIYKSSDFSVSHTSLKQCHREVYLRLHLPSFAKLAIYAEVSLSTSAEFSGPLVLWWMTHSALREAHSGTFSEVRTDAFAEQTNTVAARWAIDYGPWNIEAWVKKAPRVKTLHASPTGSKWKGESCFRFIRLERNPVTVSSPWWVRSLDPPPSSALSFVPSWMPLLVRPVCLYLRFFVRSLVRFGIDEWYFPPLLLFSNLVDSWADMIGFVCSYFYDCCKSVPSNDYCFFPLLFLRPNSILCESPLPTFRIWVVRLLLWVIFSLFGWKDC
jgi:hypothetical protein